MPVEAVVPRENDAWLLECNVIGDFVPGQTDAVLRVGQTFVRYTIYENVNYMDVTDLVRRTPDADTLEVTCEARGNVLGAGSADLTAPIRWHDGKLGVHADVQLTRAAPSVSGLVLDAGGRPAASAAVVLVDTNGPVARVESTVRTEETGRFLLVLPSGGNDVDFVVLFAGHAPFHRKLVGGEAAGLLADLGTIQLDRGVTIRGTVVGEPRPAEVSASLDGPTSILANQSVIWIDGQPFLQHVFADVDEAGGFEIVGLAEREYAVHTGGTNMLPLVPAQLVERRVRAPASGLVLEFAVPRILIHVADEADAPIGRARVEFALGHGPFTVWTQATGTVALDAPPLVDYTITVTQAGYAPLERIVSSPAAGTAEYWLTLRGESR